MIPVLPNYNFRGGKTIRISDSSMSQDICPPISQIVLKNFIKIRLKEILIKLIIVLKISVLQKH
jgi:hypothetical protein